MSGVRFRLRWLLAVAATAGTAVGLALRGTPVAAPRDVGRKVSDSGHAPARRAVTPTSSVEFAAMRGDVAALRRYLDTSPDRDYVNRPGLDGYTPLHAAAEHGRAEALVYLIGRGARVDARLATGETPLDLAEASGRGDCASELGRRGGVRGAAIREKAES